ncbi:MAG: nucleotidyltransferase domain-containing protein [Candidatus Dormiibacterota bacterium]
MSLRIQITPGTQVVDRDGRVGVALEALPDNRYRVRYADDSQSEHGRADLVLRKEVQGDPIEHLPHPAPEAILRDGLILKVLVGSQAFGLATDTSDRDLRGVFVAAAELQWSLRGAPSVIEPNPEEAYWELERFLVLGLKANPNILECLFTQEIQFVTEVGTELLGLRQSLLSKLAYQTYNGYVLSQFKRIEADMRSTGHPKWKHAMHLIRLLLSGISLMERGVVLIDVADHRDRLLAIRRGEMAWDDLENWRLTLHARFDAAYRMSSLLDQPDAARVNDFLVSVRRRVANG